MTLDSIFCFGFFQCVVQCVVFFCSYRAVCSICVVSMGITVDGRSPVDIGDNAEETRRLIDRVDRMKIELDALLDALKSVCVMDLWQVVLV